MATVAIVINGEPKWESGQRSSAVIIIIVSLHLNPNWIGSARWRPLEASLAIVFKLSWARGNINRRLLSWPSQICDGPSSALALDLRAAGLGGSCKKEAARRSSQAAKSGRGSD